MFYWCACSTLHWSVLHTRRTLLLTFPRRGRTIFPIFFVKSRWALLQYNLWVWQMCWRKSCQVIWHMLIFCLCDKQEYQLSFLCDISQRYWPAHTRQNTTLPASPFSKVSSPPSQDWLDKVTPARGCGYQCTLSTVHMLGHRATFIIRASHWDATDPGALITSLSLYPKRLILC